MQHSYRTKGWAKRLGAMAMTLVMLFGLMAAGLPQAQAVTQDDINNLKSQAASLSSQKADIQKKLDTAYLLLTIFHIFPHFSRLTGKISFYRSFFSSYMNFFQRAT